MTTLFKVGQRVYVWDEYKSFIHDKYSIGGGRYQGGRAFGSIISISDGVAEIKYDDLDELVAEFLTDLRTEKGEKLSDIKGEPISELALRAKQFLSCIDYGKLTEYQKSVAKTLEAEIKKHELVIQ